MEMKEGVFVFLDCLGFKGIWNRYEDYSVIINKFNKIKKACDNSNENFIISGNLRERLEDHLEIRFVLLSDTIALSVLPKKSADFSVEANSFLECLAVRSACAIVLEIIRLFLTDEPRINLRGCVSYGSHLIDDNLLIGKAVDEAAEFEKYPEGAFIWLTPQADKIYKNIASALHLSQEEIDDIEQSHIVIDYKMPIKGGLSLKCSVINPLLQFEGERKLHISDFLEPMEGNRVDVWVKSQNTEAFLNHAESLLYKNKED